VDAEVVAEVEVEEEEEEEEEELQEALEEALEEEKRQIEELKEKREKLQEENNAKLTFFYVKRTSMGIGCTGKSGITGDYVRRNSGAQSQNPDLSDVAVWALSSHPDSVLPLEKSMQDEILLLGTERIFKESFMFGISGSGNSARLAKVVQSVDEHIQQSLEKNPGVYNAQLLFVAQDVLDSCPVGFRNPDAVLGNAFSDQDKEIVRNQVARMRGDENGRRRLQLLFKKANQVGDEVSIDPADFQSKMEELGSKSMGDWGVELDHLKHFNATTSHNDFRIETATGIECDICLQTFGETETRTLHQLRNHVGEGYWSYQKWLEMHIKHATYKPNYPFDPHQCITCLARFSKSGKIIPR
jgi:hypothetical protein